MIWHEWNRVKNKSFFIASNNYTFLRAMVDENIIYLSVRDDSFCLTSEEMIGLYGNVINSLFSYYPIDGLDYSNIDGVFFEHMLKIGVLRHDIGLSAGLAVTVDDGVGGVHDVCAALMSQPHLRGQFFGMPPIVAV